MLRLQPSHVSRLHTAGPAEVAELVQSALELEFALIPPYLTAMLSLKPDSNREVWDVLHSVVIDEMLHMALAANLLSALGSSASIARPDFLRAYPSRLPMAINTDLLVPLQPYSPALVEAVFMEIEEPEQPIAFPHDAAAVAAVEYATIGQFYRALAERLLELGDGAFVGDPARQLHAPEWFGDRLQPILTAEAAAVAIEMLVVEGEGTSTSPLDVQADLAHYYRFQQLVVGRRLVPDTTVPEGFSFTGPVIPQDPAGVWPLTPNQRLSDLDPDSQAGRRARRFAVTLTRLLQALHATFNGEPAMFDRAMGLMFELKLEGQRLCALPAVTGGQPTGLNAGPVFSYLEHA